MPGMPHLLSKYLNCTWSTPATAPDDIRRRDYDIFTIRQLKGRVEGLTVGSLGDIAHSRVATATSTV